MNERLVAENRLWLIRLINIPLCSFVFLWTAKSVRIGMKFLVWKLHVKCGNCVILQATFFKTQESVFIIIFWRSLIQHIQSFSYPLRPECHLHNNVWVIRETWLYQLLGLASWAFVMFDWLLSRLLTHGSSLSCCGTGCWTANIN